MDAGKIIQVGTEEDYRERPTNQFVADFLKSHMHGAAHA